MCYKQVLITKEYQKCYVLSSSFFGLIKYNVRYNDDPLLLGILRPDIIYIHAVFLESIISILWQGYSIHLRQMRKISWE